VFQPLALLHVLEGNDRSTSDVVVSSMALTVGCLPRVSGT